VRAVLARVSAVVVAVALVVGALAVRDRRGDGTLAEPSPGTTVTAAPPTQQVLCGSDLAAVCEALAEAGLDVSAARDGSVGLATTLADGPAADVLWVTVAPLPDVVDERRQRGGDEPLLTARAATPVSSPVVLVGWEERLAALDATCGGAVTWACVGEHAGEPWTGLGGDARWGDLRPAFDDPTGSSRGLLGLTQAVADRTGGLGFSLRDLQDDATRAWLTRLVRAVPGGAVGEDPVVRMLQLGRAAHDLAAALEVDVAAALPRAGSRGDGVEVRYPGPWLEAALVVAGTDQAAVDGLATTLSAATTTERLAEAGYRVDGAPPPGLDGAPPRPADAASGPSAGAVEALLGAYGTVAR
jgi:hypothetical protein